MKIRQPGFYTNKYLIDMDADSVKENINVSKLNYVHSYQGEKVSISEEGLAALKEVQSIKSKLISYNEQMCESSASEEELASLKEAMERLGVVSEDISTKENLMPVKTNEIVMDHYFALLAMDQEILKGKDYDNVDVAKAIIEAYETRYAQIVKEHEEGTRQIPDNLAGIESLTLEEDLAELDEAFKMRLLDLEGFIYIRQVNKEFAKRAKPGFFNKSNKDRVTTKKTNYDNYNYMDKDYTDTAVAMVKQAREEFLSSFKTANYKQGMAREVLSRIISSNAEFLHKTQLLNKDYFSYYQSTKK